MTELLKDVIDIHVHVGPEAFTNRKYEGFDLAEEAAKAGTRAIVLKKHIFETATIASRIQKQHEHLKIFGGIALNEWVGGFNAAAVEAVADLGGKIVWFPTLSARHEHDAKGLSGGITCFDDKGEISAACNEVMEVIAGKNMVLATGHLSVPEQVAVVKRAHEIGIRHILVNHPSLYRIGMDCETQKSLLKYGVLFERNYGGSRIPESRVFEKHFDKNLRDICAIGAESSIMATDLGQPANASWSEGYSEYIEYILGHGVTEREIDLMTRTNPAELLELD